MKPGILFALLAVLLSPALGGGAGGAAAPPADAAIPAGTILWVGAHPDDEVLLAPLLGDLCVQRHHRCVLLVATRGEAGACRLRGGCHPDLATVRGAELRAAAAIYHAEVLQGTLPDLFAPDPPGIRRAWAAAVGGEGVLLDRLTRAIDGVAPRTLITFDPRHGSTCHDAHRAIGALALDAVKRLRAFAPAAFLLESRVRIAPGGTSIRFSAALPGDPRALRYDANTSFRHGPATAWSYLLTDAGRQPSQFDATFLSTLRAIPARQRNVYLLPAGLLGADPTPVDGCIP